MMSTLSTGYPAMLSVAPCLLTFLCGSTVLHSAERLPNFVVIYADDLGYGDLGCFGHPTIRTPHLDRMADEGLRFTQFYSASSVCTPSRAALLTGRLPIRSGMCSDKRRVLFPDSGGGIPADEITLAEALKTKDYATGCFGKWHLGHLPQFLPTSNGFDSYFGIPYSNDMDRVADLAPPGRQAFLEPKIEYWNVPLMRDAEIIERPADQTTITRRYTQQAVEFIRTHRDSTFFVYLPHSMVHVPLFRSASFEGVSARGLYGDCLEEVDWSVGQVLQTLRDLQLDEHTWVFFSSDNGPWLVFHEQGGSAGLLRDGKGCTFEGGMRVPTIAWGPGRLAEPGRVSQELGSTMDIFTTCLTLAGVDIPDDRVIDGVDLSPLLLGSGPSPRKSMLYYRGTHLMAARLGPWKAHYITQGAYGEGSRERREHDPPLLYHLGHDPGEQYNVNEQHPQVLAKIDALVKEHRQQLDPPPSQLDIPLTSTHSNP
jgi:arylsulfatase A-like enzyme